MKGKVIIFSAPSGSGKTTIVHHLLSKVPGLGFSISATTRPPRGQEQHGKDYYFLSVEEFRERAENGEFLEYEEVYENVYYGTLNTELVRIWGEGKAVLFDVDVHGGLNIKKKLQKDALSVFVKVTDMDTLRGRLGKRATDTESSIQKRLMKAQSEMGFEKYFDVVIVNDKLEDALKQAEDLVHNFMTRP